MLAVAVISRPGRCSFPSHGPIRVVQMKISRQGAKLIDGGGGMGVNMRRRRYSSGFLLAAFIVASVILFVVSAVFLSDAAAKSNAKARDAKTSEAGLQVESLPASKGNGTALAEMKTEGDSPQQPPATSLGASSQLSMQQKGPRLTTLAALKEPVFVRLMESSSKQWLSRAIDTNVVESLPREKIFLISFSSKYKAYAIQGHTRMYLTCELNNRVTLDRMWARSFEMWHLSFDEDGRMTIKSRRNQKFIRTTGTVSDMLNADVGTGAEATKWEVFLESSAACSSLAGMKGKGTKKEVLDGMRDQCWGPLPITTGFSKKVKSNANTSDTAAAARRKPIPLFGSPKPLKVFAPQGTESTDTFTIAQRTLMNWASIDSSMVPLILADDNGTQSLVESINHNQIVPPLGFKQISNSSQQGPSWNVPQQIRLEKTFEVHKHFKQPTYRGLFDAALRVFPDAEAVMYSNSDILYTPALAETIRTVIEYVEREKMRKLQAKLPYNVKGWMIVGQRVNHDVPADWSLAQDKSWVDTIERQFVNRGELFESDAEDYFIVSRGLFDWMKMPEFIVGGVAFDNWLTNKVNRMAADGLAIEVDGSKTITALHQNHCLGGNHKCSHAHEKSGFNQRLADQQGGWELGHTADAAYATDRRPDGTIAVYDKHRLLYR